MRALDPPKDVSVDNETTKLNGASNPKNLQREQELGTKSRAARAPRALRAHGFLWGTRGDALRAADCAARAVLVLIPNYV